MFDPYHRWLGIPPDQRPPTYYQLLGISPQETNPEVISEAALRQVNHVRTYQTGPYAQQALALLNEIAAAKRTLLTPDKRQAYDAQLAAARPAPPPLPTPDGIDKRTAVKAPPRVTEVAEGQTSLPGPVDRKVTPPFVPVAQPVLPPPPPVLIPVEVVRNPRPQKQSTNVKALLIGGAIGAGGLLLALGTLLVVLLSPSQKTKPPVVKKAETQNVAGGDRVNPTGTKPGHVDPPPATPPAEDAQLRRVEEAVRAGRTTRTPLAGLLRGDQEQVEIPAEGALLTGFEVGTGTLNDREVVRSVRPIYRSRKGRVLGVPLGAHQPPTVVLEAKPGYAVGGVTLTVGVAVEGISLNYLPIEATGLNPDKVASSDWVGEKNGTRQQLGGDGATLVGVVGRLLDRPTALASLGLVKVAEPGTTSGGPTKQPRSTPPAFPGEVSRFDTPSGRPARAFTLSADGKLAMCLCGPDLLVLELSSGTTLRSLTTRTTRPVCMAASKDWSQVLVGGSELERWDVETGKGLSALDGATETSTSAVALSPDGRHAVAGSAKPGGGAEVRLWNFQTGKIDHRFPLVKLAPTTLGFTADGKYLVASGPDCPLAVWEVTTRALSNSLPPKAGGPFAVAPAGGSRVVLGAADGTLCLWDCEIGGEGKPFAGRHDVAVSRLAVSADGRTALSLATGFKVGLERLIPLDPMLRVWDVEKGAEVARVEMPDPTDTLTLSADGRSALVGGLRSISRVELDRIPRSSAMAATPNRGKGPFTEHTGPVASLALSVNGKHLVSAGEDGLVCLWDAATGKVVHTLRPPVPTPIISVRVSPNSATVLALDQKRTVHFWDMDSGKLLGSSDAGLALGPGGPTGMGIDANDVLAVCLSNFVVPMRLNQQTLTRGQTVPARTTIRCAATLHERNLFALGDSRGYVHITDLGVDKNVAVQSYSLHKGPVLAVLHNPKTRTLITGSEDNSISLVSPAYGLKRTRRQLLGHAGPVTCLAISPDGKRLVSGSKDKTIRVWSLTNWRQTDKFTDEGPVLDVVFSADGKQVFSAGQTLRVWSLTDNKP